MKHALINEQEIRFVEDALTNYLQLKGIHPSVGMQALRIIQSLKLQDPVAWLGKEFGGAYTTEQLVNARGTCFEPLYGLEQAVVCTF